MDVLAAVIMANHFHTILCNRPDIVDEWSDKEVARRWLPICPHRRDNDGNPVPPTERQIHALANNAKRIAVLRKRLSDISWCRVGRVLESHHASSPATPIRAFADKTVGPTLIAALLACMAYVDLNPIRAGIAETPETSELTSAYCRIQTLNMLEDLANTTPPDADARRRDETTGAESNLGASSAANEPLAASDAAGDGPAAAKQAAESKIDGAMQRQRLLAEFPPTSRRSWNGSASRPATG